MMQRRIPLLLLVLCSLCVPRLSFAAPELPPDLLELQVKGIALDPDGNVSIVILEARANHKAFPIWIGQQEAQAIYIEMEEVVPPRPLTHVLLQNVLTDLDVKVVRIVIHALRENTFYASILLQQGPKIHTIDARPSDAIALALGAKAPIFVAPNVLAEVRTVRLSDQESGQPLAKTFGMHLQSLNDDLAHAFHLSNTDGVLVAFVEKGSKTAQHGIRRGDVITSVNGQRIKTVDDVLSTLTNASVPQHVLRVTRDRQAVTILLPRSALE